MDKEKFVKDAASYIDASQLVKAAQEVLGEKREELIPAFKKFIKPDEKGNRVLEFTGHSKISLVPQRKVDEEALKTKLGPDAARFTERAMVISTNLIRINYGAEVAAEVEEVIKETIRKTLQVGRIPAKVVQTISHFDSEAALASLPKDERLDVKETVTFTLRPYPQKAGYKEKVEDAKTFLNPPTRW